MSKDLNTHLREQLSTAPERYLGTLTSSTDVLSEMDQDWNSLISQVTAGIDEGWLDDDVVQLAHRSATLIAACVDFQMACKQSLESVVIDVQYALAGLTLDDVGNTQSLDGEHARLSKTSNPSYVSPPEYIEAAFEWLLANTHNPYPSTRTKALLAARSNLSSRQIHDWFKTVRRSVGWVHFCQQHFRGSRALAIETASRVLLEQDRLTAVPLEVELDILTIRGRVECLYRTQHVVPASNYSNTPFLHEATTYSRRNTLSYQSMTTGLSQDVVLGITGTKTSLPRSSLRKRRHSDAGIEETSTAFLPGKRRKQVVSDPLPYQALSGPQDFKPVWVDLSQPATSSVGNIDVSRPMTVIPQEWSPSVSEENFASLACFVNSLESENPEPLRPPVMIPETALSIPFTASHLPTDLSFADPSLAMDALDKSATSDPLPELLWSYTPYDSFEPASLPDTSSDSSSVSSLSPPRTPTCSTFDLSNPTCLPQPCESFHTDLSMTFPSSFLDDPSSAVLDQFLRENGIEENPAPYTHSLTEGVSVFGSMCSPTSFDFLNLISSPMV